MSQSWTPSRPWLVPSYPVRDYSRLLPESKLHCTLWLTDLLRSECRPKLCPSDGDTQSELAPRDVSKRLIWQSLKHLREPGLEQGQGTICAVCVCLRLKAAGWTSFISQPQAQSDVHTLRLSAYPSDIHSSSNMTAM